MLKYVLLAVVVLAIAVLYVFLQNPCASQIRAEFAGNHPTYTILDSVTLEGSRERVRCEISYTKPDVDGVFADLGRDRFLDDQGTRHLERHHPCPERHLRHAVSSLFHPVISR